MTTSYRRRADVPWRRSLDAVLCLPPDAAQPVTLADTGPEVGDLLETRHSMGELAAELAARRRTSAEIVFSDARPVLERLVALGLIEPVF